MLCSADFRGRLQGEILAGFIGGSAGEKIGAMIEPFKELGREAGHSNFGGEYEDNEAIYTMRQRAVQEMGSSALNAPQYLGKEALMLHE